MHINYKSVLLIFLMTTIFVSCKQSKKDQSAEANYSTEKLPNIVLIVADDLGYGGISSYGNTYIQTPNLDYWQQMGSNSQIFIQMVPSVAQHEQL